MYRRHFPKDVQVNTGHRVFKQTLKISDAKGAKICASEVNTTFNQIVRKARAGVVGLVVDTATAPEGLPQAATPEECGGHRKPPPVLCGQPWRGRQ